MSLLVDSNNFDLSLDEIRVLRCWQDGDNMTEAYRKVMLSGYDAQTISQAALRKRVIRFFGTYRMRQAMAATPGLRGEKAREELEAWDLKRKNRAIKSIVKDGSDETITEQESKPFSNQESSQKEQEQERQKSATTSVESVPTAMSSPDAIKAERDKWLESLNVNENPSSMTIYGTGQFLAYMAVREIMARQNEIKQKGISVLDKNGSVLTPVLISALKTAASMVLPFAPAPSAEDRKQMSKAAVLLGLLPDNIIESPDDYVAPIPSTIEIEKD